MTALETQNIRLVLLGGGHSNTQVIKQITKSNLVHCKNVELLLVSDYNNSLYSGMCPGGVANQYKEAQFSVDLLECCQKLQWIFTCKKIVEIDDINTTLIATDGTQIKYDILCIDIGSTNLGLSKYEGIKQYAITTRPLKLLMDKVTDAELKLLNKIKNNTEQNMTLNIITVGGGCAGCELIMCLTERFNVNIKKFLMENNLNINVNVQSTLITNSDQILMHDPKSLQLAVLQTLHDKNINIITKHRVTQIDKDLIYLLHEETPQSMKYDVCIWSTGAAAQDIKLNNIATDDHGWIKVNKYLQSVSHPNIFAAGDCVNIVDYGDNPHFPPKSGVYAVREGPVLIHNLLKCLETIDDIKQDTFREYIPQTEFLRLLNIGNGKAIGNKHGISFKGAWVWRLKDWIDVCWMNKFKIDNLLAKDSKDFKPEICDQEEKKVNESAVCAENAVKLLQINDEPDKCDGFALQWKVLLHMNDDDEFCRQVIKLFEQNMMK